MFNRRILFNQKLLLLFILLPVFTFLRYFVIDWLPIWDVVTSPEQYNLDKNYSVRAQFMIQALQWGNMNTHASNLDVFYPSLIVTGLVNFKEDLSTYFVLARFRFSNYRRALIQTILKYSLTIALTITASHAFIYLVFSWITPVTTDLTLDFTAYTFNFWLPGDFFDGKPLLYYVVITLLNDLPVLFTFSVFFSVLTLYTRNNLYAFILVPVVFGYAYYLIGYNFGISVMDLSVPFLGYGSKVTEIWQYTIIPLVLSLIGLISYFIKGESRV